VLIQFRPVPHLPTGLSGTPTPDLLRLSMGPDQISLEVNVNGPGDPLELDRVALSAEMAAGRLPAYGEVLAGVLDGDPLLAVRGDTAEECWRIVDPVLEAWRANRTPLDTYPAGSTGPAAWE
jgi:glucose-6-phosphate 1-dehydrogenase